jgi:sec-independent protein translocase protein TatA
MLSGFENPFHVLIVLAVVLLLFGAKRLPEIGRSLGAGMREFRDGITGRDAATPLPPAHTSPTPATREAVSEATNLGMER